MAGENGVQPVEGIDLLGWVRIHGFGKVDTHY